METLKVKCEIDYKYYEEVYSTRELEESVKRICTSSDDDFNNIKSEKWYLRFFKLVILTENTGETITNQISSIAEAQLVTMELVVILLSKDLKIISLVKENLENISTLQYNNIYLAETFQKLREKIEYIYNKQIYEIDLRTDIKEFSDINKRALSGFLYKLTERYQPLDENQKKYLHSVINYIGIKDLIADMPLSKIESISDIFVQKAILRTGIEFVFLKNKSFDFMNEFGDILDFFSINNKGIEELKVTIKNIYNKLGTEGFIRRFHLDFSEREEENNFFEFEYIEPVIEEPKVIIAKTKFNLNNDIIIENGESEIFENKIIDIDDTILVKGNLIFNNCEIHFKNDKVDNIVTVTNGGTIDFNECIISTDKPSKAYVIDLKDATLSSNNTVFRNCIKFVKFEHTSIIMCNSRFENCSKSMFTGEGSDTNTVEFDKCVVHSNIGNFLIEKSGCSAKFNECGFISNKSLDENENYAFYDEEEVFLIYVDNAEFKGCYFEGNNGTEDIRLINGSLDGKIIIGKSEFKDIICKEIQTIEDSIVLKGIIEFSNGQIDDCKFYNTTGLNFEDEAVINNSKFIKCIGKVLSCCNGKINTCSFKDCINNGYEMWECIININSFSENDFCEVQNCVFEGCDTSPNQNEVYPDSIIRVHGIDSKANSIATIRNCIFRKCNTSTGAIIDSTEIEEKLFRSKVMNYAYITECQYEECKIS